MIIGFNAFENCNSLHELHFEKCNESLNIIFHNYNEITNDDIKIIVHDKVYSQFLKTVHQSTKYRLLKYSNFIEQKIDEIENSNIILSIIYLYKVLQLDINTDILQCIKNICNILIERYKISDTTINYVKQLLNKKQEILDESET